MELHEPAPGRQVYTREISPEPGDIDQNGHVNNVVYLHWVQEIATAHWYAQAPPDERDAWGWIVLRHEVDYRRPLRLGEVALMRTWVGEAPDGPRYERFVRVDGPGGAMCVQTRTVWCLIDRRTGQPRRVPEWMPPLFT